MENANPEEIISKLKELNEKIDRLGGKDGKELPNPSRS